jgi:hypothetical protein
LELGIALEAFVREQFHHLVEGKRPIYVSFRAGSLDGIIGTFCDTVKKPVNALFFCGWVKGIVVGHLRDYLLKQVNVFGYVSPIDVS